MARHAAERKAQTSGSANGGAASELVAQTCNHRIGLGKLMGATAQN